MLSGSCHCGQVTWTYASEPEGVTACNCRLCRRYGALWAYGHIGHGVEVSGPTLSYSHARKLSGFHFCKSCGCLAYYMANAKDDQGRIRAAVNLRMIIDHKLVENLPIDHFDGLDSFDDLPRDGKQVKDLWF